MIIRSRTIFGGLPLILLWGAPFAVSLSAFAGSAADGSSWRALFAHPQLWGSARLSLWTGAASTLLAVLLAMLLVAGLSGTAAGRRLQTLAGAALALPHLAFAIGFGFLIMPSGVLARLLAGGDRPPDWITTQDPWGLALIAALALKETPFLALLTASLLLRGDWAESLAQQRRAAASLGHGGGSIWLRVVVPQLLPRLAWPVLAVFAYGATVVDMALVIGPSQPPTLAVLVWHDLNAAEVWRTGRGAAGAALLTLLVIAPAVAVHGGALALRPLLHRLMSAGPSGLGVWRWPARVALALLILVYAAVAMLLMVMSFAARWPWPELMPAGWQVASWQTLAASSAPALLSLALAAGTSLFALVLAVLWFETVGPRHDRGLLAMAGLALILPVLVTAGGLYRAGLFAGLTGTLTGLFVAHLMPVAAYCLIALKGPYRSFDQRLWAVAAGLTASRWRFWFAVKAPLLKSALLTAGTIGFSVSFVQFVPAQLMAAGRYATLPMEAVSLAAGGDRPLLASYALALALPQALVFLAAALLSRARWSGPWR